MRTRATTARSKSLASAACGCRCTRADGGPADRDGGPSRPARARPRDQRRGAALAGGPAPHRRHDRDQARGRRGGHRRQPGARHPPHRGRRGAARQPALPIQAARPAHRDGQPGARARGRGDGRHQRGLPLRTRPARRRAPVRRRPRALPGPRGTPARGGPPRADGRHLPARGRPPRRHPLPRPGPRSRLLRHLGAVRPLPPGGVRGAGARAGGAHRLVRRVWCEHAWLGGSALDAGVLIEIEGERFEAITTETVPSEDAERLDGITLPGLANAHSHAFQRVLRGRSQAGEGSFWTWREEMYGFAERMDPDACFAIARACFGEMALAGVTCVGEFHYLHHAPDGTPYEDPNTMGAAVIAAAREAGLRITLLDACYLHGGLPRFRDADAHAWAARVEALEDGPGVRVGAAIHSVRAVDPAAAAVVAEWASGRPLHAHVSEQVAENEQCIADHGRTPTALLAAAGAGRAHLTTVPAAHPSRAGVRQHGGG